MKVNVSQFQQTPLLEVEGEIDHGTCSALEVALGEAMVEGHTVILVDLEKVSYIDSGGLSVFLTALRRLRGNGWLGVVSPNANVKRLLEIVGLTVDDGFRVFPARDAAAAALSERTSP